MHLAGPLGDFSWPEILTQFGFYPPALVSIAAAIANPSYSNIAAVDRAYRQGGYQPPPALMNWLWGKYYDQMPIQIPGGAYNALSDYWPLILGGLALVLFMRRR